MKQTRSSSEQTRYINIATKIGYIYSTWIHGCDGGGEGGRLSLLNKHVVYDEMCIELLLKAFMEYPIQPY